MNSTVLKAILLGVMFIVALFFGLLPIKLISRLSSHSSSVLSNRASFILSLISCFAGGVFLGVSFLDMMPDALEALENVKTATGFSSEYPFVPLVFCLGFFFVYLAEEAFELLCGKEHEISDISKVEGNCDCESSETPTPSIVANDATSVPEVEICRKRSDLVKSITFVMAFLFHAGIEGFAFGVQKTTVSITSLFFGIIVHKAVVSFSIGLRLVQFHSNQLWLVFCLVISVSIIAPIGGVIGILVEDSNMNDTSKNIVESILLSLAIGTFIYITFFEILVPEHVNKYSNIAQWLASFVGFAIIAGLMVVE